MVNTLTHADAAPRRCFDFAVTEEWIAAESGRIAATLTRRHHNARQPQPLAATILIESKCFTAYRNTRLLSFIRIYGNVREDIIAARRREDGILK